MSFSAPGYFCLLRVSRQTSDVEFQLKSKNMGNDAKMFTKTLYAQKHNYDDHLSLECPPRRSMPEAYAYVQQQHVR